MKTLLKYLAPAVVALGLTGCSSDDGGGGGSADTGGDRGFTLTDVRVGEESIGVDPAEVDFVEVPVGETDIHEVLVINQSTAPLKLTDIRIVQTDNTVTFANLFLGELVNTYGWRDLDADRQDFEERDGPITVIPGGTFSVLVQYRPDGGLLDCLDRAPANCGLLRVTGEQTTAEVELFVPRGE